MNIGNRYALLSVDTEALPKRAAQDHVKRLIWGEHAQGTAGIREMCEIGDEFNAKHVFFVDLCGAYPYLDELRGVVRWLDREGQDVQLHTHPEYLPEDFWVEHGLNPRPQYMNQYSEDARAEFVIKHFGKLISDVTGKEILAYRAGSFRWNACTIRALKAAGIPLSFNNSMCAYHAGQCLFSEPTNLPYLWSNGVVEVPMTEKKILSKIGKDDWWARLTHPQSSYFQFRPWWGQILLNIFSGNPAFSVFLLHSWSLLYWDEQGYGTYLDDRRMEGYRKLLMRLTKDYDVITTKDFLDLHANGTIATPHTVDLSRAEIAPSTGGQR